LGKSASPQRKNGRNSAQALRRVYVRIESNPVVLASVFEPVKVPLQLEPHGSL
jgi:hypothetical protein